MLVTRTELVSEGSRDVLTSVGSRRNVRRACPTTLVPTVQKRRIRIVSGGQDACAWMVTSRRRWLPTILKLEACLVNV